MPECIFCQIVEGKIPSKKVRETEFTVVFEDIDPKAPVHYLAIPKKHISSFQAIDPEDLDTMADLTQAIQSVTAEKGLDKTGYRVVTNIGDEGGQTVSHLHYHILGGRQLTWPPG